MSLQCIYALGGRLSTVFFKNYQKKRATVEKASPSKPADEVWCKNRRAILILPCATRSVSIVGCVPLKFAKPAAVAPNPKGWAESSRWSLGAKGERPPDQRWKGRAPRQGCQRCPAGSRLIYRTAAEDYPISGPPSGRGAH